MHPRDITINGTAISDGTAPYVIAEIGHNHEGRLESAEEIFRRIAESGANAVKLQKRDNRTLFTKAMYEEPYTGRNSFGPTYGEHREALEFGRAEYVHLSGLAAELGLDFMSTAFDLPSVDFLADIGVAAIKVASGDLTNTPLLAYAAKVGVPLVVSTGGADLDDVRRACDTILPINPHVALLQCTAVYPARPEDLNLSVISAFREEFPSVVIGFSGHDAGSELSLIAYALGARVIEKHVTLDRTKPGSDHHFSLTPEEVTDLVQDLLRVHQALGSPVKQALPAEAPALRKMGKKLVAARDLPAGHELHERDVAVKSPGDGMLPYRLPEVIGRSLAHPLAADADIIPGALR
ncbi:N-acetylneuraminate synthase [Streptomyces antimycoticus]|uniref:N-acetylneuraminate synthase n=1 Tax=Streptomyces antimycoticus TaxID=68175 RepID=A0A499UDM0_9ACTN|nr:N-acetylneuraminate synthase family protein [Streptomyces antimycoticus]BBJ37328.1 N-acetylneuraminate synthase [Streptomyces antimycoticus]